MIQADSTTLQIGNKVNFKIIEFNKNDRLIIASHTRTWQETHKKEAYNEEIEATNWDLME
jgi:ribosomal protein S1